MQFVKVGPLKGKVGSQKDRISTPVHESKAEQLWFGVTEVTIGQWKEYFRYNLSHQWGMWDTVSRYAPDDDHPILCISLEDAMEFCRTMTELEGVRYRLPTEEEWELVARNGGSNAYIGDDEFFALTDEYEHSFPVRQLPPSELGIYGMRTNAWEWTQSEFLPYPDSKADHPLYSRMAWVLRGGGFRYPTDVWKRNPSSDKIRNFTFGLRVVRKPTN
ncbi:MAG: SUMF1/EgtB/PvdO family nonheme iron enzyme [Planctomycetota bacterium]|nr:SUMF1/EgtB/PvdO family nonheme iron enzyme [Planctomycetota bacterium]